MSSPMVSDDWAEHADIADALPRYLRDADLALDAIRAVVDPADILAFTCELVLTPTAAGESIWQEVAVTDGSRLILWHGVDEMDDASGEPMLSSSVSTIPLSSIVDQGLRVRYAYDADGGRRLDTVLLYLETQTPERSTTELGDNATTISTQVMETYRFSKSRTDGGPLQMQRLIDFATVLSRSLR